MNKEEKFKKETNEIAETNSLFCDKCNRMLLNLKQKINQENEAIRYCGNSLCEKYNKKIRYKGDDKKLISEQRKSIPQKREDN